MLVVIALAGSVTLLMFTLLAYLPRHNKNIFADQHITLTDEGILLETQ